jgi:hypothetical protein
MQIGLAWDLNDRKKTIVRATRMTDDVDRILERDAAEKGIPVGTLLSTILRKYVDWDRLTEKYGFISVPNVVFKSLLEEVDADKIARIGKESGKDFKERLLFWFKEANVESLIALILITYRYSGLARCEYQKFGDEYVITLKHDLGRKWSIYTRELLRAAVNEILAKTSETEITEYSVMIRFSAVR